MGFFNKALQAAMPKMLGNPIATAVAMISVGVSVLKAKKGQKVKKATKGSKKTTVRKSKIVSKKQKKQMEVMERVCQSAYGIYIRGATTVAARYIGHPAVAIPASEMVKTMMDEVAPKVNYLVQLETGAKKENAGKEQKEGNILEYAKKGAEYVEGYYDSYWKAFNGEQVIDEKYTLENLFSGNLTIEDIPDIPELINMVGATKGALSRGVWNSAKGTFDTVKTLVTEPGKVWDAVSSGASDFIEHPWESTKEFVSGKFNDAVDAVWRSTPQDMAEDVGEIVGDVAVDALTAGSGAVIVTGLKTGAKKLTISAGKTVTKTVTKTAGKTITKTVTKTTGKTAIKEAGKKTIKELMPDATTVKKWIPKDLPINEGWLKNVVTAGGDINALKKNNYQLILPNDKKSIKDVLQKTSKNTAKETVGEFAENKAVNLTKDKIAKETKKEVVEGVKGKAIDVTENKVVNAAKSEIKDEAKNKIVKEVKDKTAGETKHKTEVTIKEVVREDSKRAGDSVHTSPAVNETKINKVETTKNVTGGIKEEVTENVANSSFRDLMSFQESIRYDKYWLDVAEEISGKALEKHITFINRGGIKKSGGGAFKPVKVSVALDLNTGNMHFGYNGSDPRVFNPSRKEIVPELQQRIERTKNWAVNDINNEFAANMSFEIWSVDNCAEVYAVNNLLRNGGDINNIFINTKNSLAKKVDKYLKTASPCRNCQRTFEGCFFPKK